MMFSRLQALSKFYPSLRGVILTILLTYLCLDAVINQSDIVASSLISTFIATFLILGSLVLWLGRILNRNLTFEIFPVLSNSIPHAQEELQLDIIVSPQTTIPFIRTKYTLEFQNSEELTLSFLRNDRSLDFNRITAIFPHRAVWEAKTLRCEVQDVLGLWKYITKSDKSLQNSQIWIYPSKYHENRFPFIHSHYRDGDALSSTDAVRGDPYDIKRYDPSDGVRKILWKVYARTQELLSRFPEPTMTPEGKTVIFVLSDRGNDYANWSAYEYISRLESDGLSFEVSSSQFENNQIVTKSEEFIKASIQSSFNSPSLHNLNFLIDESKKNSILKEIVIFFDLTYSADWNLEKCNEIILSNSEQKLGSTLMLCSALPIIKKNATNVSSLFSNLFYESNIDSISKFDSKNIQTFLDNCQLHGVNFIEISPS